MTAGILAALSPAATTASVLYSTSSSHTASSVLTVAERGNSAATYRVGHKDYTQKLTMDANTYAFRRGNPISTYKMEINPGISRQDATPGLLIGSTDLAKSAYILDAVVETATITNYVKVKKCTSIQIDTNSVTGTFQGGETLTGGTSGLTATFRGLGTSLNVEVPDIASGATSLKFVDGLALNGNPGYFVLSDGITGYNPEIILAGAATFYSGTTGGANVAVTRAQFGTTAAAHPSGQLASIYTDSGTTTTINEGGQFAAGDTTLTVTDGTTIVTGTHIRVGNEIMLATGVTGNDVTVTRGVWGTTDAAHNDGSTVTPMVQGSQALVQWFDTSETLTGGTTNATATTQFTATSSAVYTTQFTWGTVAGREIVPSQFSMDVDRTYLFDQSDSSNTGLPLRFSDTQEGTGATPTAGTEYTTGVTKAGTAGTDGTIEIIPTVNTPDPLYYYAEGTVSAAPDTQYSSGIDIVTDPQFTELYLYDVDGTWVTGDTFQIGTATQTVGTVTGGKYGWVSAWSGSDLYVTLGTGSAAFAGSDVFVDTPRGQGADRANATVSSVTAATDLETKDYIYYDVAISANSTNEHKGLVVGPNSHLIVYASSANLSFQVNGFANTVSDWEAEQYNQTTGSAGGGA
tara:strand:+ start:3270 stop:5165 length:1896 start_codon:yes stop_codon:yes gene_type:complete